MKKINPRGIDMVVSLPARASDKLIPSQMIVESVRTFLPWVGRIHIPATLYQDGHQVSGEQVKQEPEQEKVAKLPDLFQGWVDDAQVLVFDKPLLEYTLASPRLAEHFLLLDPRYIFANYVFPWQFFLSGSPVVRSTWFGCTPCTRRIFNECWYRTVAPPKQLRHAVREGVKSKLIRFKDNRDGLTKACLDEGVTKEPMFQRAAKDRTQPFRVTLCLIGQGQADDRDIHLPEEFDTVIQIWVRLSDVKDSLQRLKFMHRMIVTNNVFVEVVPQNFNNSDEQCAVETVRRIRNMVGSQPLNVSHVFSYLPTAATEFVNSVAHKVAAVYEVPAVPFPTSDRQSSSWKAEVARLQAL
jgi:hypothetical protein